ncbi:hypothetical protein [Kingella potus]|uniref:hypothetical protein n=1 Tax=Kingella potus TaxID=265175 RepID=UPI001FD0FA30|nr:hypothetical protein [Kingella potus]UOP00698.1 hypothetical protein LVJ84_13015 [Kingella potus]
MNIRSAAIAAAALIALAACEHQTSAPQAETAASAAQSASAPAPETQPAAPAEPQTLTSRDGAVSITVTGGFQDQSGNAALLPEGASPRK